MDKEHLMEWLDKVVTLQAWGVEIRVNGEPVEINEYYLNSDGIAVIEVSYGETADALLML